MEKFSPEDQVFVTACYRNYKSNPKQFALTVSERTRIVRLLDLQAFDIIQYIQIEYQGYATGVFMSKEDFHSNVPGEETKVVKEVILREMLERSIRALMAIRRGNIPDKAAISAAYLQMGISHGIIPSVFSIHDRKRICSETWLEACKREEKDGIINN